MRKIYSLVGISLLGVVGMSVSAQSQQIPNQIDRDAGAISRTLIEGGTISTADLVGGIAASLMDTTTPIEQQISAIEGPLISEIPAPEVNQTIAESLIGDAQTGRYPPRLKINFAEFPLRTIEAANGENSAGRNGRNGATTDSIVQRIQTKLRIAPVDLVVQNRTATVSGMVTTERQRNLIASMLRFEPGIDAVNNELTVGP